MPTDAAALYAATRSRIAELVADLPAEDAARPVPGCPGWTVHDLLAHLSGSAYDFVTGNLAGAGSPEWTRAQVDRGRGRPTAEVVAEWLDRAAEVDAGLPGLGPLGAVALIDAVTHEHDLRGALGRPGARDDEAVAFGMRRYAIGLGSRTTDAGLGAVRVVSDEGDEYVVGEGDPRVTVAGSRFELFRALAGRRSRAQVGALRWDADPEPYLAVFPTFGSFAEAEIAE